MGVAIVGLPARELMDGRTLEVVRVCTLGHEHACTRLYGACRRAATALGWQRLYTYTRADEPGTSPAAAGFVRDGVVPARDRGSKLGARRETRGAGDVDDGAEKVRWRLDLTP